MPDTNEPLLEREKQVISGDDADYYKNHYAREHKKYLESMADKADERKNDYPDVSTKTFYHNGDKNPSHITVGGKRKTKKSKKSKKSTKKSKKSKKKTRKSRK